jgi:hypothetical protein
LPVTAKLSRKFYERFGDDVAGELVDWFNAVDSTYQSQLREMNDLNWERFKAELRAEGAAIRSEIRTELRAETSQIRVEISQLRSELMKWMFVYWTGTMAAQAAFVWTVLHR